MEGNYSDYQLSSDFISRAALSKGVSGYAVRACQYSGSKLPAATSSADRYDTTGRGPDVITSVHSDHVSPPSCENLIAPLPFASRPICETKSGLLGPKSRFVCRSKIGSFCSML